MLRRPFRFVSIGEAMVEMAPGAAMDQYRQGFAGDTFNTAWYLTQLHPEMRPRYVTRVGVDDMSDRLLALMERAGMDVGHVQRCAHRTLGLYLISLHDGERSFSYWRDQSAAREMAQDEAALKSAAEGADLIYFSGITLGILDTAGRNRLLGVLDAARDAGAVVAFDSNLRPRLWASSEEMCAAVMHAAAVSDVVLPSYDDEAAFFGDAGPGTTLTRYLGAGATTVIVKNGPGEVIYSADGTQGTCMVQPATQVVDTTSAGDSFNAGIFAGMADGADIEDAIGLGATVARHVIGEKGALVPLPRGLTQAAG